MPALLGISHLWTEVIHWIHFYFQLILWPCVSLGIYSPSTVTREIKKRGGYTLVYDLGSPVFVFFHVVIHHLPTPCTMDVRTSNTSHIWTHLVLVYQQVMGKCVYCCAFEWANINQHCAHYSSCCCFECWWPVYGWIMCRSGILCLHMLSFPTTFLLHNLHMFAVSKH